MLPRSGRLVDRIRIQRPVPTRDSMGGQSTLWLDVTTKPRSAEVTPQSARADTEAEALSGLESYRVTMRYERALRFVDATHRLIWDGRVMKILGAVHDSGRRQETVITCEVGPGVVTDGPPPPPAGAYTPSLDFSDARNSQYVPLLGF